MPAARLITLTLLWALVSSANADIKIPDDNNIPLVTLGLVLVGGLLALAVFVTYIWCLVNAAKNGKWVWFVLMIFFQLLAIFYILFADKRPPSPPSSPSPYGRREPYLDR